MMIIYLKRDRSCLFYWEGKYFFNVLFFFVFVFAFEEMLNAVDAITLNNKIYFCLNSNEDIDTNQLPQQLMKGELEGYERCFFSVYLAFKSYSCYLK